VKRFRFSLEKLLRVKEQRERLAEAHVAQARREVQTCQERLARLDEALVGVSLRLQQSLGNAVQAETLTALFAQASRLERAIRAAEALLQKAETALREAIQERTRLSTEVEALDTLREQRWDEYRQEYERSEQERLDELGMRAWMKNRRKREDPRQ
jgi:flagellar FliJ protein